MTPPRPPREERRRPRPALRHALSVHLVPAVSPLILGTGEPATAHMEIRCACGKPVGGRDTDRVEITLNDLLALVRIHGNAV